MSDDFDDLTEPSPRRLAPALAGAAQARHLPAARLVARVYRAADESLRGRMLACLLSPLSPLALAAVAAGAFARFIPRPGASGESAALEDLSRYSSEQVQELAVFVQQVNPQALQQVASLLADNSLGLAAFSASVALLLYRRLRPAAALEKPLPGGAAGPEIARTA